MNAYSISCYAMLVLCVLLAPDLSAQDKSVSESRAASFRKRIVKEWHWQPKHGVALTTTEFAREYVERYAEKDKLLRKYTYGPGDRRVPQPPRLRVTPRRESPKRKWVESELPALLEGDLGDGVVLFQTDELDIIVLPHQYHDDFFAVVDRTSQRVLLESDYTVISHDSISRVRFIDADDELPFELLHEAFSRYYSWLQVWDLTGAFAPMLELERNSYDAIKCPAALPEQSWEGSPKYDPKKNVQLREDAELYEIIVRESYELHLVGREGYCEGSKKGPRLRRRCTFQAEERQFTCEVTILEPTTILLEDLKLSNNWRHSAKNIRWVLNNADKLKARGYRFPEGFLERLPRHLPPEDTPQKDSP